MALNSRIFNGWVQKVLPLVYDESLSYYEVLGKLLQYLQEIAADLSTFQNSLSSLGIRINNLETEFQELQQLLEDIANGKYIDFYLTSLKEYIDNNLQELVSKIVQYVVFGLTNDGYFAAYIPESWDFITFSTIPYGEPLEGHLVLEW